MPSQGFSTSDAPGEAHTTHQSKLCYKRAFYSGEGMGRGWEWVGLVKGGGVVVKTLRSVRPYCARCAFFVHRDNTQSDVLGVVCTNCVDGVDRSLVCFTKKHVDKAEWTEKKGRCRPNY